MTFSKALHLLKQGAKIRRKGWSKAHYLQAIANDQGWGDSKVIFGFDGFSWNSKVYYRFEQKDIMAEDWEILKDASPS